MICTVASIFGRLVIVSVDLSDLVKIILEKSVTDPCVICIGTFTVLFLHVFAFRAYLGRASSEGIRSTSEGIRSDSRNRRSSSEWL